jgi:hypothetical protein
MFSSGMAWGYTCLWEEARLDQELEKPRVNNVAEQENQTIELYGKQNAHWDPKAVEEEIKAALKSSARKNVASLEEDRWMFEGGAEKR